MLDIQRNNFNVITNNKTKPIISKSNNVNTINSSYKSSLVPLNTLKAYNMSVFKGAVVKNDKQVEETEKALNHIIADNFFYCQDGKIPHASLMELVMKGIEPKIQVTPVNTYELTEQLPYKGIYFNFYDKVIEEIEKKIETGHKFGSVCISTVGCELSFEEFGKFIGIDEINNENRGVLKYKDKILEKLKQSHELYLNEGVQNKINNIENTAIKELFNELIDIEEVKKNGYLYDRLLENLDNNQEYQKLNEIRLKSRIFENIQKFNELSKKVPVYFAAGNSGPDYFDLYSLSNVISMGVLDNSGQEAAYSASNDLISEFDSVNISVYTCMNKDGSIGLSNSKNNTPILSIPEHSRLTKNINAEYSSKFYGKSPTSHISSAETINILKNICSNNKRDLYTNLIDSDFFDKHPEINEKLINISDYMALEHKNIDEIDSNAKYVLCIDVAKDSVVKTKRMRQTILMGQAGKELRKFIFLGVDKENKLYFLPNSKCIENIEGGTSFVGPKRAAIKAKEILNKDHII
ncbi:MAG: hypothetical protein WCK67_03495 [bacterium]